MQNNEIFKIADKLGCEIPSGPEAKEYFFCPTELVEFANTILANAALAQAVPTWQDIETAPKDGTNVLIVNDEGAMDVAGYVEQLDERSEFVRKARDGDVFKTVREDCGYWDIETAYCPTHWMPLPQPPKPEG